MLSFKEYLNNKTINESVTQKYNNAIKKGVGKIILDYKKNDPTISDFNLLNNNKLEKIRKEINEKINQENKNSGKNELKEIKDVEEFKKIWEELENLRKLSEVQHGDISKSKEPIDFICSSLIAEKDKIKNLSKQDIQNVFDAIRANDKNKQINKKEFLNGIKELKDKYKNLVPVATVFYLLNIRQYVLDNGDPEKIFNDGGKSLDQNIKSKLIKYNGGDYYVKVNAGDKNKKESTDALKHVFELFEFFNQYQFEAGVLSIFKNIYEGVKFLQKTDEEIEKAVETLKFEKTDEEAKKENAVAKIEDNEEKLKETNKKLEEIEKNSDSNKRDSFFAEAFRRKNFFIFDINLPETFDDIDEFKNKLQSPDFVSGPVWFIEQIKQKIEGYEIKKKKNDLEDDEEPKIESVINKCLEKSGYKIINEDYEKEYNEQKTKLIEELNGYIAKVQEIIGSVDAKKRFGFFGKDVGINTLQVNNKKERKYTKVLDNETKMRKLFIPVGEKLTNLMLDIRKKFEPILFEMNRKYSKEKVNKIKTLDQEGQDNLDIKRISSLLSNSNYADDAVSIAKFFLTNVLKKNTDSEEIKKILLAQNFGALRDYIYTGDSGKVFALNSKDVKVEKIANGLYTVYNFVYNKVRIFKNPRDLLNHANINIDNFINNIDILKGLKNNLKNDTLASSYIDKANKLTNYLPKSSIVTEGLFDFGKKNQNTNVDNVEDVTDADENSKNTFNNIRKYKENETNEKEKELNKKIGNSMSAYVNNGKDIKNDIATFYKNTIELNSEKIVVPQEYGPTQNGPEDIAMRQIFKGFVFITNEKGENYITSQENYKIIQEKLKQIEETYKKSEGAKNFLDAQKQEQKENKVDWNSSIVTSGAADSTYGDGYGYNKKADAIKKKLNCTTYTYSPNPKMKIVRRTFD